MAINIKDPATDELARKLAALTGEKLTEAIRISLQERYDRVERRAQRASRQDRLYAYIERARARPVLDERSLEDLLYDEDGLPA